MAFSFVYKVYCGFIGCYSGFIVLLIGFRGFHSGFTVILKVFQRFLPWRHS